MATNDSQRRASRRYYYKHKEKIRAKQKIKYLQAKKYRQIIHQLKVKGVL